MKTKEKYFDMRLYLEKARRLLSQYGLALFLLAVCLISFYYGIEELYDVDFVCTNGDYQNYNVLRRVLDGQIPYHDFANYLGMGVLILCAPLLAFHNTFAGSLFVTHFVAAAAFMLLTALVFYLITGRKLLSALGGLLLPKLLSSRLLMHIPYYGYYVTLYLEFLAKPSNSFRIARMFLTVLLCAAALLWRRAANRKAGPGAGGLRTRVNSVRGGACVGFAVGLGVTWSNDFGFACIGSAFLVLLILAIADAVQERLGSRAFRRFLGFFPALALGMLLSALIASRGHLGGYLSFTSDVADWQFWYYGERRQEKIYSLIHMIRVLHYRTWIHWGVYLAVMLYCLYRLCKRKENDRLILFVFLFTSFVAGQVLYTIGSGKEGFTEGVYGFVLLCIGGLAVKGLCMLAQRLCKEKLLHTASTALAAVYILYMAAGTAVDWRSCQAVRAGLRETDVWVEQLDGAFGYTTAGLEKERAESKAYALKEMYGIVGDAPLFSTFATALDDMKGSFQPTGADYIIHALGDGRFERYVEDLRQNQYPYVQTTSYEWWPWEVWMSHANWEVYRELYANYAPAGNYAYWTLWAWQGEAVNVLDADVTAELQQLDENRVQVTVRSAEQRPCYVDVALSWDNDYIMNLYRLQTFRSAVFVDDGNIAQMSGDIGFHGFFQPSHGNERHISVYMENGVGSVILEGHPVECTRLTVHSAEVGEVILSPYGGNL